MIRKRALSRLLAYGFVVTVGFVVDFIIYSLLVMQGISIYLANLAAFGCGTVTNVALLRRYIFPNNRFSFRADLVLSMFANGLMLGLGMAMLWLFAERLGFHPLIAKLCANGITFLANYLTRSVFFAEEPGGAG